MTMRCKCKEHGVKADPDRVRIAASLKEGVDKSISHFGIRKPDRDIQRQVARFRNVSHREDREPPVGGADIGDRTPAVEKLCPHIQILIFRYGREYRRSPLFRRNDAVGVVYANLTSRIDAILSFPAFDQPRFSAIIKIDRQRVKNHAPQRRQLIVNVPIAIKFLPCVSCTREDVLIGFIPVTKWLTELIQEAAFVVKGQAADLMDKLLLFAVKV